jgi:hypothetical protein
MSISIVKMLEQIMMRIPSLSSTQKRTPSSPLLGLDLQALQPVGGLRMSMSTDRKDGAEQIPNREQQPKKATSPCKVLRILQ